MQEPSHGPVRVSQHHDLIHDVFVKRMIIKILHWQFRRVLESSNRCVESEALKSFAFSPT